MGIKRFGAERSLCLTVSRYQQLQTHRPAADDRDKRGPLGASDLGLEAHGSYRSTNTPISPPHGSPTSQASESAIPKCSRRGSPPFSTSSATATTAPSTQPPDTAPDTSPRELIAIFAPGGRGAERFTSITVASATSSPRATHASTSSITSFMRVLLPSDQPAPPVKQSSCRPENDPRAAAPRASRG